MSRRRIREGNDQKVRLLFPNDATDVLFILDFAYDLDIRLLCNSC